MAEHGVSSAQVVAWPVDRAARLALEDYLRSLEEAADGVFEGLAAPQFDFTGADLSGLDLSASYLLGARLNRVSLAESDPTRADLAGAELEDADLSEAKLAKAELVEAIANRAVLLRTDAFATDFSRAQLRHADARGALFTSARFRGADLSHADLRGAVLSSAGFGNERRPTRLTNAKMAETALVGATGMVVGPVDVGGEGQRLILDGAALAQWFADHGASEVSVVDYA